MCIQNKNAHSDVERSELICGVGCLTRTHLENRNKLSLISVNFLAIGQTVTEIWRCFVGHLDFRKREILAAINHINVKKLHFIHRVNGNGSKTAKKSLKWNRPTNRNSITWMSVLLWSPYVIGQTITFLPCSFFLLSSFFPRQISAVGDWMSTILLHMAWP